MNNLVQQLNEIEHQIDELQIHVRRALFQIEKTLSPVDVIFLYKIIELVGYLTDHAQQTENHLQLLTAK